MQRHPYLGSGMDKQTGKMNIKVLQVIAAILTVILYLVRYGCSNAATASIDFVGIPTCNGFIN